LQLLTNIDLDRFEEKCPDVRAEAAFMQDMQNAARTLFGPDGIAVKVKFDGDLDLYTRHNWVFRSVPPDEPWLSLAPYLGLPSLRVVYKNFLEKRRLLRSNDHHFDIAHTAELMEDPDTGSFKLFVFKPHQKSLTGDYPADIIILAPSVSAIDRIASQSAEFARRWSADHTGMYVWNNGDHSYQEIDLISKEDVILPDSTLEDVGRSLDLFFNHPEIYTEYNIPYKRGVLLAGPPGNGKTTLLRLIASKYPAVSKVYWTISANTTEEDMRENFAFVVSKAPSMLFIEDLESIQQCPKVSRTSFLNQLDGLTSKKGVYLIGTTNYPEQIDPALVGRVGRFDRLITVGMPDVKMRLRYLERILDYRLFSQSDIRSIAEMTDGLSLADLNEIRLEAVTRKVLGDGCSLDEVKELIRSLREARKASPSPEWGTRYHAAGLGFSSPEIPGEKTVAKRIVT